MWRKGAWGGVKWVEHVLRCEGGRKAWRIRLRRVGGGEGRPCDPIILWVVVFVLHVETRWSTDNCCG